MIMKTRALAAAVTADDSSRRVRVVCSTATVDRYGDTVVQAGIDLSAYRRLKTVLWNHDHDQPIAKTVSIDLIGDHLEAVVEFPPEGVNAKSDNIYGLIKAEIVNAVSIGFGVLESTPVDKGRRKGAAMIDRSDLWELSFVSVPANPDTGVLERAADRPRVSRVGETKGLWQVSSLAGLLQSLAWLEEDVEWEAECEGDGSEVPAMIHDALVTLGEALIAMTVEEVGELLRVETAEVSTKAAGLAFIGRIKASRDEAGRVKAGRMISKATGDTIDGACKAIETACSDLRGLIPVMTDEDVEGGEGGGDEGAVASAASAASAAARRRRVATAMSLAS